MAKKLVRVWLSLTIVLFSSITIYADENVQGDFFVKHVIINGEEIINYNLQYPFFIYDSTMYFPLSPEMGEICGFTAEMDWESRTLKILKTDSTRENISTNWMKNNMEDINTDVLPEVTVACYEKIDYKTGLLPASMGLGEDFIFTPATEILTSIARPELSVEEIDLEGMPVLSSGNYIFFPVRTLAESETLNWDIYFDPYYGICISTNEDISAETYCDKDEVLYNKGLVAYMQNYNSGIKDAYGQELLFFFKRATDVYSVETELLMAIAHKESTFNASATARGGALGMMQVMPATGANYGLSREQLYDAKTSIDFGAMYISERIAAYGGDWTKGLSAYNQGSSVVNRGTHSTAYATNILSAYNGIQNFVTINGYVAQ